MSTAEYRETAPPILRTGGAERQYLPGWTAVLIRNLGGAERA